MEDTHVPLVYKHSKHFYVEPMIYYFVFNATKLILTIF